MHLTGIGRLAFGDPNGLTKSEKDTNGEVLRSYAKANAELLGFDPERGPIAAPSFHPMFRATSEGVDIDMVVELVQTQQTSFD